MLYLIHSSIPFFEASYLVPIGRWVPAPVSAYLAQALTASPFIGSVGWSTYFLERDELKEIRGWFFSNPLKCFFGVSSGKCLDFAQSLASDLHAALPLYWWPDKPERSAVMVQSLAPNYRVEVRGKDLANHSFGGSIRSKGGGWRVRTIARGWGSIPSSRSISKR